MERESARIFVVDDEPVNLKLLDKLLSAEGYGELVVVQDPREVLGHYLQKRPDLILLDINMPHLSGYEVLALLKERNDPLMPPVSVLTANSGRDHLLQALAAGARDFLGKPFDRTELLMRVRNLLDAQLAHRMMHDQKAVLEEMVRARTEALNDTRLQVVRGLGRAAEFRDTGTGLHFIRMSKDSALLASKLGWSEAECELLLHASPMHDVGKIGIPDAILLKPGKLEPEEWRTMQTHATIGGDILADDGSALLRMACEIALSHHEKWDGSGYPAGLAGALIPEAGRIVAVADVFDALTSVRPYKKAWAVEDARAFIVQNASTHFDPAVVAVFEAHFDELLEIREHHLDPT